jgi:enamine deaminase RidA (YjgF/YER057c/UK114 family)
MNPESDKPHAFNPPNVPKPPPTYNQVCVTPILPTSKLITLAGQTGLRDDQTIPSDFKEQAKGAYESVHNCLKAAGATPRDIVCREFTHWHLCRWLTITGNGSALHCDSDRRSGAR